MADIDDASFLIIDVNPPAPAEVEEDDLGGGEYATYCPDCEATFGPDEVGFDFVECMECGSPDVYEVPW